MAGRGFFLELHDSPDRYGGVHRKIYLGERGQIDIAVLAEMMRISAEEWQQPHGRAQEAASEGVEIELLRRKGRQPVEHDLVVAGDVEGGDRRGVRGDGIGGTLAAARV